MKRILCVMLSLCLLLAAAPFAVSAAGDESGTTGACTWTFNSDSSTLTISGNGAMADYYSSTAVPWFQNQGRIKKIIIGDGVTRIGDYAFYYLAGVKMVNLPSSLKEIGNNSFSHTGLAHIVIPDGVTKIGAYAFTECSSLSCATLPESLQSVGRNAFLGTAMKSVAFPGTQTQFDYYCFGYDSNGSKVDGFTVYGYPKATSNTYANSNGFNFREYDPTERVITVHMGRAVNLRTYQTGKARLGDRVEINKMIEPNFNLKNYVCSGIEIEEVENRLFFTMPAHSVEIFVDGDYPSSLVIDFSNSDSRTLSYYEEDCLTESLKYNKAGSGSAYTQYDLNSDGTPDVRMKSRLIQLLPTCSISGSIQVKSLVDAYNPITFIFSGEPVSYGEVRLALPSAGDTYNWENDSADVTPWSDSHFTVVSAKWYTEWGIAPDKFTGGQKYFVEMTLKPDSGYAFLADCRIMVHGDLQVNNTSAFTTGLDSNGNLLVYTANYYVPGEEHAIHVNGGMAAESDNDFYSHRSVNQARAGDKIWVHPADNSISDDEFVVSDSVKYSSDQVTFSGEAGQYFIMPDEDVYVNITFEKDKVFETVMDLRGGRHFISDGVCGDENYPQSQTYGLYRMLTEAADSYNYDWETQKYFYDIDGDGNFDIEESDSDFSLLGTSSLSSPSGKITLTLRTEDSVYFPVRSLTIIFADPAGQKHGVVVRGGFASSDSNGTQPITEAVQGQTVYLNADISKLASDEYIVQLTQEGKSDDVEIINDTYVTFTMPDKDVTVDYSYYTSKLIEGVMDLRNGSYRPAVKGEYDLSSTSENYGMYFILQELSGRADFEIDENYNIVYKYDIDNFGGYDIAYDSKTSSFSLLDTNSLRPASGRITLELPADQYHTVPMHRLTILLAGSDADQTKHKITVNGGIASSELDSYSHRITSEYMGEAVYILPDPSAIPEGKYIVNSEASSDDVQIEWDMVRYFIMPDRDVTIDFSFTFGDTSEYTFDFTSSDTVTAGGAQQYNEICRALASGSPHSKSVYDSELGSWLYLFDIDGDGKCDIRGCAKDNSFLLLNTELKAQMTVTPEREDGIFLKYSSVSFVFTEVVKGDVDGDGTLTINDATMLQRYLAEFTNAKGGPLIDVSNQFSFSRADANSDGKINVRDVTAIQRALAV